MSKSIQKPSHLAAVENAARVADNAGGNSVQAGCVVAPEETLLAACVIDGVGPLEAAAQEELLAACVVDTAPAIASEK